MYLHLEWFEACGRPIIGGIFYQIALEWRYKITLHIDLSNSNWYEPHSSRWKLIIYQIKLFIIDYETFNSDSFIAFERSTRLGSNRYTHFAFVFQSPFIFCCNTHSNTNAREGLQIKHSFWDLMNICFESIESTNAANFETVWNRSREIEWAWLFYWYNNLTEVETSFRIYVISFYYIHTDRAVFGIAGGNEDLSAEFDCLLNKR